MSQAQITNFVSASVREVELAAAAARQRAAQAFVHFKAVPEPNTTQEERSILARARWAQRQEDRRRAVAGVLVAAVSLKEQLDTKHARKVRRANVSKANKAKKREENRERTLLTKGKQGSKPQAGKRK